MNTSAGRTLQRVTFIFFIFILFFAGRCSRRNRLHVIEEEKAQKAAQAARTKNLINTIKGISYTEVRRRFDNGLSFSNVGYQLIPEWKVSFPSGDSINIFSPKKNMFLNAPVVFDHDSIFSMAWAWLKLRYLGKDSMQFMVLHVHDNVIQDEKTHVFMTFYSNNYIKNVLHSDTTKLWAPSRKDTLYIQAKTQSALKNINTAFAGTTPATLTSKSKLVTIKKEEANADSVNAKSYDSYLSPTFDIVIHKAYDDFNYTYTAFVDEKGVIIFRQSGQIMMPEFKEATITAMKGITDGYLKLYVNTTPAKTLGIAHPSIIFLNVEGHKK